jgi:hypothetical protein
MNLHGRACRRRTGTGTRRRTSSSAAAATTRCTAEAPSRTPATRSGSRRRHRCGARGRRTRPTRSCTGAAESSASAPQLRVQARRGDAVRRLPRLRPGRLRPEGAPRSALLEGRPPAPGGPTDADQPLPAPAVFDDAIPHWRAEAWVRGSWVEVGDVRFRLEPEDVWHQVEVVQADWRFAVRVGGVLRGSRPGVSPAARVRRHVVSARRRPRQLPARAPGARGPGARDRPDGERRRRDRRRPSATAVDLAVHARA